MIKTGSIAVTASYKCQIRFVPPTFPPRSSMGLAVQRPLRGSGPTVAYQNLVRREQLARESIDKVHLTDDNKPLD